MANSTVTLRKIAELPLPNIVDINRLSRITKNVDDLKYIDIIYDNMDRFIRAAYSDRTILEITHIVTTRNIPAIREDVKIGNPDGILAQPKTIFVYDNCLYEATHTALSAAERLQALLDVLPPPKRTHLPVILEDGEERIWHIRLQPEELYICLKDTGNILQVGPYIRHEIRSMSKRQFDRTILCLYEYDHAIRDAIIEFALPSSAPMSALHRYKTNRLYEPKLTPLIFDYLKNSIPPQHLVVEVDEYDSSEDY